MSKIFEALQRGAGELPESILPELEGSPSPNRPGDEAPGNPGPPAALEPPAPASGTAEPPRVRVLPMRLPKSAPLLPFDDSHWDASEQYRMVRTKIIQHVRQPRVIVVSSAGSGDGKSVTAINIAGALSLKAEAKVLLLDGDFRRSTIHTQLGLAQQPGLAEVLQGACTLEDALIRTEQLTNLYVLPAGAPAVNPAELLDSPRWPAMLAACREQFRYVVIDSPPVAAVADYNLIEAACDGIILVARPDYTNRRALLKTLDTVAKEKLLGVLLNCVRNWFLARYTSPYYYSGGDYRYKRQGA